MADFDITKLKEYPNNPRKISRKAFEKLQKSLEEFNKMLKYRPIVYDPKTMQILGGNQRFKSLVELGFEKVPKEWVKSADDLTEKEKRRFIFTDNVQFGKADKRAIKDHFDVEEIVDWFDDIAFPDIRTWGDLPNDDDYQPDYDSIKTKIKPGDLYRIGEKHLLMCGDSTNAGQIGRLFDFKQPHLMVTDPPYGVDYDPEWRNRAGLAHSKRVGKVTNDDQVDWSQAYHIFPGDVAYIWHAGVHTAEVQRSVEAAGFEIISQIIWVKSKFPISQGNYHWQHEPCWYAVRKGKTRHWQGSRRESTIWESEDKSTIHKVTIEHDNKKKTVLGEDPQKIERAEVEYWEKGKPQSTVWRIANVDIAPEKEGVTFHGTQKPIECMARPIRNNSMEGQVVYDPFIGSGTTMVAAEQLNRACYGVEIDPKYCQIVIDRMKHLNSKIKIEKL